MNGCERSHQEYSEHLGVVVQLGSDSGHFELTGVLLPRRRYSGGGGGSGGGGRLGVVIVKGKLESMHSGFSSDKHTGKGEHTVEFGLSHHVCLEVGVPDNRPLPDLT